MKLWLLTDTIWTHAVDKRSDIYISKYKGWNGKQHEMWMIKDRKNMVHINLGHDDAIKLFGELPVVLAQFVPICVEINTECVSDIIDNKDGSYTVYDGKKKVICKGNK